MHNVSNNASGLPSPTPLIWRGNMVERGDASSIAKLTDYKRSYVDKVLRGTRKSEKVEKAAQKFFKLRKELRG